MILSITAHRPSKLGGFILPNPTYLYVCREIEKQFKLLQPQEVIMGGAMGGDQYAAMIAYKLGIPYTIAIPFEDQERTWSVKDQKTYRLIRKLAHKEVIVSPGGFANNKYQIRNVWMVDHSDKLLAIFDGSVGGTNNCVEYARSIKRDIIRINPDDRPTT